MSKADESAFPYMIKPASYGLDSVRFTGGGLTKREYFAGLAMQGMLASELGGEGTFGSIAKTAVDLATALLAELEKKP